MLPDPASRTRYSLDIQRFRFLNAVEKLIPATLQSLREDVLPSFKALFVMKRLPEEHLSYPESGYCVETIPGGDLFIHACISWRRVGRVGEHVRQPSWATEFRDEPVTSERAPFRTKLLQWAARWNLRDEWILDHALTTLLHWLQQPCDVGLKWRLDSHYFISPDDFLGAPKLQIDETWDFEPWEKVEGRIMARIAEFKSAVERYSAVVAFDPQDAGTSLHHYEWLALYQCKGYSAGRIQKWHKETHQESVVESTITHAIDSRADRIGLTKRKSKRGNGKSKT